MYLALSSGPERILYSSLSDGERAQVVDTLESGNVDYSIDNSHWRNFGVGRRSLPRADAGRE